MKKLLFALCVLTTVQSNFSCPTCVGTLSDESPAFFSEELYEQEHEVSDIQEPITESK